MTRLFEPIRIGGLTLPNRIVIAPMCQYSAEDGRTTDWHTIHLGHLAFSGAGALVVEATAVTPEGRITAQDLGLWSDETQAALAGTLKAVRRHATMPILLQLAHAGRKASTAVPWRGGGVIAPDAPTGWRTVAPSATPFTPGAPVPEALDADGLDRIRLAFAAAARRAVALGLDGIEIHAAHGYLLHEFLSPLSNHRADAYGGSLENRLRFPLEVIAAVREAVPAGFPVLVRLSATDWAEGGWDIAGSIAFAKAAAAQGADAIHVSSGGLTPEQKIALGPGYQVAFAAAIKAAVDVPVIAVGLITEAEQAETILATGQADAIALARAILYDPRWPWHAAATLGAQVEAPPQYWRSQPRQLKTLFRDGNA